ncbi:transporter substrate-binding domain-containing protein [Enterovibrio makurazakiensis]|uniref:substrate-binding periplasmic protein n=1 Tax=Enterovibrio makurazakiensis TaxID=2910232 RepID=UPI003D24992D
MSEILPPFQVITPNGGFQGRAVDMVKAILEEADLSDATIDVMPWARAYKKAQKEKNVAIFSIAYSEKRAMKFHWIGPLYSLERSSLIGLKSRTDLNVPSLDDAKQFRVCSELDTHSYQYLQSLGFEANKNLFSVRSVLATYRTANGGIARPAANLTLLNAKKCDYVTGLWSIYAYSENANNGLTPYFYLGQRDKPLVLNMALSLQSDPAMLTTLTTAYRTLLDSGALYRVCVGDDPEKIYQLSCQVLLTTKEKKQ